MMLAAQIIKTAQGYPVTINDSQSGAAVDYTVWGNTETGKNLFDTQGWYNWLRTFTTEYVSKTEVDGISCIYYRPNVTYNKQYMKGKFKEKTRYTISFRAKGIVGTSTSTGFRFVYTDGTDNRVYVQNKDEWNSYKLVSNVNKTIDHIEMVYNMAQGCYFDENSIQLEEGAAVTEYEPYTESYVGDKTAADEPQGYKIPIVNSASSNDTVTNIYLNKQLKQGESVNFGADNLPELQLFEGSNIITADTEVKPEKIVIDYYEKG